MKKTAFAVCAALCVALSCAFQVQAESVYRLDATTTEGLDLTAMDGYYADRMEGPLSANVNFAGPLTVDPSVSESNPFQLIGNGKTITVTAADSGFHTLPLVMYNAAGKTGGSALQFNAGWIYSGGVLDVGKYNTFKFGYLNNGNCSLESSLVNVLDGGKVSGYGLVFGRNHNLHMSVTNGASITAEYYVRIGEQTTALDSPLTAFLGITNATVKAGRHQNIADGKAFVLMGGARTADNTTENCRVVIGPGGLLEATTVVHHGGGRSAIVFDGGKYKSTGDSSAALFHSYGFYSDGSAHWPSPHIVVHGINGNPIDVEISTNRVLASGASGDSRRVYLTGDGGFVKRGTGTLIFTRKGLATCDYTGPTTIYGGGIVVTNSVFKPGRGELTVASGAFLDLNGFDVEFSGAVGDGVVSNGSDRASTLALGWDNADSLFNIAVSNDVSVMKIGTGTLTVGPKAADFAGNLVITGGVVNFAAGVAMTNLDTVTISRGATLDVRGRTFACRNLVKAGTLLTDDDTTMLFISDGDANFGGFPLQGTLVKGGTGTMSIYGDGDTNCNVVVEGGTLLVRPLAYGGKYFKVNVFKTSESVTDGTAWHKYIGEFSLYDAAGNRVNAHAYTYNERPRVGQYNGVGGVANASGLAEWEVALATSGFTNYDEGHGPDKALDGDPATYHDNMSWWGAEAFMFRMPASVADVVGYTFTTYAGGTKGQSRPVQWKIYGSEDGVNWTTLADNSIDWSDETAREALLAATPGTASTEYNNGVPYTFDTMPGGDVMPFGPDGTVTVSGGGTLEFSSSTMRLPSLTVDCSKGGGTIRNFTPAENGVLRLYNLPQEALHGQYALPVAIADVITPNVFKTWRVFIGDSLCEYVQVGVRDGHLVLCGLGMTIIFR
ncbi:MAG: hypothetical protein J6V72_18395 [Kiritimatiellae bacterium]|nr:hypothetical protein [Kiritimatiellia bacterium]